MFKREVSSGSDWQAGGQTLHSECYLTHMGSVQGLLASMRTPALKWQPAGMHASAKVYMMPFLSHLKMSSRDTVLESHWSHLYGSGFSLHSKASSFRQRGHARGKPEVSTKQDPVRGSQCLHSRTQAQEGHPLPNKVLSQLITTGLTCPRAVSQPAHQAEKHLDTWLSLPCLLGPHESQTIYPPPLPWPMPSATDRPTSQRGQNTENQDWLRNKHSCLISVNLA